MNDVHCWTWTLNQGHADADLLALLSAAETAKAQTFRRAGDRDAYLRAHVGLRMILSRYAGRDAAALRFTVDTNGKPHLADGSQIAFNLAHTREFAICAIASQAVGIDIERATPLASLPAMLEQVCTSDELAAVLALPRMLRESAFYSLWVRKEAWLKAIGSGLLTHPTQCAVGVEPWSNRAWRNLGTRSVGPLHWCGRALIAPDEHVAAVVVAAEPNDAPQCRQFQLAPDWANASGVALEI